MHLCEPKSTPLGLRNFFENMDPLIIMDYPATNATATHKAATNRYCGFFEHQVHLLFNPYMPFST